MHYGLRVQFRTGCCSIPGIRDFFPKTVLTFESYCADSHSKAMCRKSQTSNPTIFNLLTKACTLTAAGDVFFFQRFLRVALLVNFCTTSINACSPLKPLKGKGGVLKQQLFEAYLPSLLHRRFKQRQQVAKRAEQQVKKKVSPLPHNTFR